MTANRAVILVASKNNVKTVESKVVPAGHTRLIAYVKVIKSKNEEFVVDGFLTFVHVDLKGRPLPHGITIEAQSEEELALQEKAGMLKA